MTSLFDLLISSLSQNIYLNIMLKDVNWINAVDLSLSCVATSVLRMRLHTACGCVFQEITLVDSNQGNYFENATACSKCTLKTTVATQLKKQLLNVLN